MDLKILLVEIPVILSVPTPATKFVPTPLYDVPNVPTTVTTSYGLPTPIVTLLFGSYTPST